MRPSIPSWFDSLSGVDRQAAEQVRRAIDPGLNAPLPQPEVHESGWGDLTPLERSFFGTAFSDTQPFQAGA